MPRSEKELISLISRALGALETPNDLTKEEIGHVIEDLQEEIDALSKKKG